MAVAGRADQGQRGTTEHVGRLPAAVASNWLIDDAKEQTSPVLSVPPLGRREARLHGHLPPRRAAPRRGPSGGRRRLEVRRPPLLRPGGRPGRFRWPSSNPNATKSPTSKTPSISSGRFRPAARATGPSGPRRWWPTTCELEPLEQVQGDLLREPARPGRPTRPSGCGLTWPPAAAWCGSPATMSSPTPTTA